MEAGGGTQDGIAREYSWKPVLADENGLEEGKKGEKPEDSWEAVDIIQPWMPDLGFYSYLPLLTYPDVLAKPLRAGFLVSTRN